MIPEVYAFTAVAGIISAATISFRRREIYSGAVLSVMAIILLWWGVLIANDDVVQVSDIDWPMSSDSYISSINILVGFCLFFIIGQRFAMNLTRLRLGRKKLLPALSLSKYSLSPSQTFAFCITVSVVLMLLTADAWWIFAPYPQNKDMWAIIPLAQSGLISSFFSVLAVHAGISLGGWRLFLSWLWISLLIGHFTLTGDRAAMFFAVAGFFALLYFSSSKKKKRCFFITGLLAFYPFFILFSNIPILRAGFHAGKEFDFHVFSSFSNLVHNLRYIAKPLADTTVVPGIVDVHGTYFDGGVFEFLAVFILQIVPGRFLEWLGFELYNGPWALAEFHTHGGGFFSPAEMYFVGGFLGLVVLSMYLGTIAAVLDSIWKRALNFGIGRFSGNIVFITSVLATVSLPRAALYGLQTWHRMATLPVVLLLVLEICRRSCLSLKDTAQYNKQFRD